MPTWRICCHYSRQIAQNLGEVCSKVCIKGHARRNAYDPISAQVIHVLGSYQVYTMPVFDMLEHQMVKRGVRNDGLARVAYRSAYVVLIAFVACSIPFFRDLMGFIGALGTGPTTFWL